MVTPALASALSTCNGITPTFAVFKINPPFRYSSMSSVHIGDPAPSELSVTQDSLLWKPGL
jgi:hypothetical protein